MALLSNGLSILTIPPPSRPSNHRHLHFTTSSFRSRPFSGNAKLLFKSSNSRIESFPQDGVQSSDNVKPEIIPEDQNTVSDIAIGSLENKTADSGSPFLSKLGIFLGIAAVITLVSVGIKPPSEGTSLGIQFLLDGSSSSTLAAPTGAFSFRAFGYRVVLPEYAPGGVCISDMIPFYLGKIFKQSGASNDIWSKLGVGKEKAMDITRTVQRYGNLIGFVERFSLGVRNPTAFLAGAMDISPECFFAGVCCGGLVTLPLQLAIGFLLRERPVFALATVATVVGIWTVFPYAVAALTAAFLYLRRRYSS
ncbi:hypothetical protein Sango_0502100 [Sesamum angolense]|uniref:VTT domain-containing protein n=1 Tax=Sesamum angolense TaxID=2727404 RepID=A0AAE1XC43_9LAMI|nr:hypothetical protein Sango_0502100 [Sesamum angolense]